MRKVFIGVGLLGLGFGVYQYYMTQALILEKWDYRVLGIKIISANLSRVEIQVDLEVTNDANISVTITDYYFDVLINGTKVGEVRNASVNQILNKNGGKSFFPLNIVVNTTSFLSGSVLYGLMESIKDSTMTFKGYFGIKKGIIKFRNIPFDETYKLREFM